MSPFPEGTKAHAILERIRESIPVLSLAWGGSATHDWEAELAAVDDSDLLGGIITDESMASAVRSGLLLRADLFDASHALSQEIGSGTGSYWHGILHRREPDFGNARYWFRRVGEHPLFQELFRAIASVAERHGSEWRGEAVSEILATGRWDPFLFIGLCEACQRGTRPDVLRELESVQELEIDLLLGFSYRAALGKHTGRAG